MKFENINFEIVTFNCKNRKELFQKIAEDAFNKKYIIDPSLIVDELEKREQIGTTGFEDGIAIPHTFIDNFDNPTIYIARLKKGINWPALDNKLTKVAITLFIPRSQHLDVLASLSTKLLDAENRRIFKYGTQEEIIALLSNLQKKKSKKQM